MKNILTHGLYEELYILQLSSGEHCINSELQRTGATCRDDTQMKITRLEGYFPYRRKKTPRIVRIVRRYIIVHILFDGLFRF